MAQIASAFGSAAAGPAGGVLSGTYPNPGLASSQTLPSIWTAGSGFNVNGFLDCQTAGKGLAVKEGANCKQGTATLSAGTVTVANTSVTASSRIILTSNNDNGGTPGFLRVTAITAATSFVITSSSGTDTSIVAYQIFEPG